MIEANATLPLTRIGAVQGSGLYSPLSGQTVRVQGVVTGVSRSGFFVQDAGNQTSGESQAAPCSHAIFVFAVRVQLGRSVRGALVEVIGTVTDFVQEENDRPTTQILASGVTVLADVGPSIPPFWLTAENVPADASQLAVFLNNLEAMLVGVKAGAIFSAPSNPFGDYIVLPKGTPCLRSKYDSAVLEPSNPERWFPGFRIGRMDQAPRVDVGAVLKSDISGPLNYRSDSYQIIVSGPIEVENRSFDYVNTTDKPAGNFTSILTLNAFNLDQKVEAAALVDDPRKDIDDDVGDVRFEALGAVVVHAAGGPEIVALQEIQDNDGAEISTVSDASDTLKRLVQAIKNLGGPLYQWVDLAPVVGADGGQPGANIRNAFLYDPARVQLLPNTLKRLGETDLAFAGSRKVLTGHFKILSTGATLALFNVHLASKRHQNSIFAPIDPGVDSRVAQRIAQAALIRAQLQVLCAQGIDYYVTGDFNDFDFSPTLAALVGNESVNLVTTLPPAERFDYNHRGKLHALMHAVVSKAQAQPGRYKFEVLHGNELIGVQPGTMGTRATDHAYVISHLQVGGS
jgi:uncharacterized protein